MSRCCIAIWYQAMRIRIERTFRLATGGMNVMMKTRMTEEVILVLGPYTAG